MEVPGSASTESVDTIVDRSWSVITQNTEILILVMFGIVSAISEEAGLWPSLPITELLPAEEKSEMRDIVYRFADGIVAVRFYSTHLHLAAYILVPYPLITERKKMLLTPWLLTGLARSLVLNLINSLSGMVLCASKESYNCSCLRFSGWHAAEFCFSLYLWMSVHNFYHYLERRPTETIGMERVLKTIHKAGLRASTSSDSPSDSLWSMDRYDDDHASLLGTEATLVERAAMAWIAREILESGGEYIDDKQFSQYLAIKATMELRQIVKELAEVRAAEKKSRAVKERIDDSLEFCRIMSETDNKDEPEYGIGAERQAFELSKILSKRDPIRKIPPLTKNAKSFVFEVESKETLDIDTPTDKESSEVQTEPLSPQMEQLFDVLEKKHSKDQAIKKRNLENEQSKERASKKSSLEKDQSKDQDNKKINVEKEQ